MGGEASGPGRLAAHRLGGEELAEQGRALRQLPGAADRLDAAGITFGLVGTLADIAGDEQMRAAGALVPFADGSGLTVSSPFEIDGITKVAPGKAPELGEHSEEVLREAGFSVEEIKRLVTGRVLGGK